MNNKIYTIATILCFALPAHQLMAEDITLQLDETDGATIQWQKSGTSGTDAQWINIDNATQKSLTISDNAPEYYRAIITTTGKGTYPSDTYPAFASIEKLDSAVWECHLPLMGSGLFGLNWILKLETLSDRIWHESLSGLNLLKIDPNEMSVTWEDLYRGLYRTCYALKRIDWVKGSPSNDQIKIREAQIRAVRAYYYFLLVTLFDNPPFYDETSLPQIGEALSNTPASTFWNKIESDLEFSIPLLPENYTPSGSGNDNASVFYNPIAMLTQPAAKALLGKALLWKHYYYYMAKGEGTSQAAKDNLMKARQAFSDAITSGKYELQKVKAETKDDYIKAFLSNFSYIDLPVSGNGNTYKSENNGESVWEVQYGGNNNGGSAWMPGYFWSGNQIFMYIGLLGYKNIEVDPGLWDAYEVPADGTKAKTAGFDRDPRAYATMYLDADKKIGREGDTLDWRDNGHHKPYKSATYSKLTVANYGLYNGSSPSAAIMLKKYAYPQFTMNDESATQAPNCAPYNYRIMRYADVLLMFAETCYLLDADKSGEGLAALNKVRDRAGMQPVETLNKAAIIKERDLELAGEGVRYLDIIRWARSSEWFNAINFSDKTPEKYKFTENFAKMATNDGKNRLWFFPIPQNILDVANTPLQQNDSWKGYQNQ